MTTATADIIGPEFNPSQEQDPQYQDVEAGSKKSPFSPTNFVFTVLFIGAFLVSGSAMQSAAVMQFKELLEQFSPNLAENITRKNLFYRKMRPFKKVVKTRFLQDSKFRKLSPKMKNRLINGGFELDTDGGIVKSIKYKGKAFDNADEFADALLKDPKMRADLKFAQRGKFGKYVSKNATKAMEGLKVKLDPLSRWLKKKLDKSDVDADKLDDALDDVADSKRLANSADDTAKEVAEELVEEAAQGAGDVEAGKVAEGIVEESGDLTKKGLKGLSRPAMLAKAGGAFMATVGAFNSVGDFVSWMKGISYTAKVFKMVSLARYAAVFLATFDAIAAGDATEREASHALNKIMTTKNVANDQGRYCNRKSCGFTKSGFDSEVFNIMAGNRDIFSKNSTIDETTERFQYGDNGKLAQTFSGIKNFGDMIANKDNIVVSVVTSPGFAIVAGIALLIIGVFSGGIGLAALTPLVGTMLFEVGKGVAAGIAINKIATIVKDRLSSNLLILSEGKAVNSQDVGAESVTAISAGHSLITNSVSLSNGQLILSKDLAQKNFVKQQELVRLEAEEIEATHSPFDITTRHTIAGRLVFASLPYYSKFSSISGIVGSVIDLSKKSFVGMLPTSSAVKAATEAAQFDRMHRMCSDPSLTNFKSANNDQVGLNMFCLPVVGLPTEYLENVYFQPDFVLARFGMEYETKKDMWQIANNDSLTEDQKIEELEKIVAEQNQEVDDNPSIVRPWFRPQDEQGWCRLNGFSENGSYLIEEIENKCDSDWWWKLNDRKGDSFIVSKKKSRQITDSKGVHTEYYCPNGQSLSSHFALSGLSPDGYLNNKGKIASASDLCYKKSFVNEKDANMIINQKVVCHDRKDIPWGLDQERNDKSDGLLRDLFGVTDYYARKMNSGKKCILDGNIDDTLSEEDFKFKDDRSKMDRALYLHYTQTQCAINNDTYSPECQPQFF